MKRLALALILAAGSSHAGVAAYEQCIGPEFEERLMANYAERFPSDRCESSATCPAGQIESTTHLTRGHCRVAALDDCESNKCRKGLTERWQSDAADLRTRIDSILATLDFSTLPPLQARRLANPESWSTLGDCTGTALTCAGVWSGQNLGDMERIFAEVEKLR
ncbi:MAG: hypothetical protein AAGF78_05445 [Pseudomonadota bacterium]